MSRYTRKENQTKKLIQKQNEWNKHFPIGTPVAYHSVLPPIQPPTHTTTRSLAWVVGDHSVFVSVEGVTGGVLIDHLTPLINYYRYDDRTYVCIDEWGEAYGSGDTSVECRSYPLLKKTTKGAWIGDKIYKKWVSNTSKKRFAYPTKEEALKSFILRKKRQINILEKRLDRAKIAINLAQTM
jgi:hypothetical protein